MNIKKILGRAALGALVLSVIPYQFKRDKETGSFEIRSLLWGVKQDPPAEGEDKARVSFAIPASGLNEEVSAEDKEPAEEPAETPAPEEPAEEPAPEEPAEAPTPEEPAAE